MNSGTLFLIIILKLEGVEVTIPSNNVTEMGIIAPSA